MQNKTIGILCIYAFFGVNCRAEEINKARYEALITRYVSVLNAIAVPNAPPVEEVKREILLSLMVNYFYFSELEGDISKKFKGITKSIGGKTEGFNVELEIEKYSDLLKSIDKDAAIFRLTLDGFDDKVALRILEKAKLNDFQDLIEWAASK